MKPAEICSNVLGPEKLSQLLEELSSPQMKAVLKEAGLRAKVQGAVVSQAKRRKIWHARVLGALAEENDAAAAELLQQWLLNHRRAMLVALLDGLEVKHNAGETDESFLLSRSQEKIREQARALLGQFDAVEAAAYLHYIAYQQRSNAFDGWAALPPQKADPAAAEAAPAASPAGEPAPEKAPPPPEA